jgi:hypothetical protein
MHRLPRRSQYGKRLIIWARELISFQPPSFAILVLNSSQIGQKRSIFSNLQVDQLEVSKRNRGIILVFVLEVFKNCIGALFRRLIVDILAASRESIARFAALCQRDRFYDRDRKKNAKAAPPAETIAEQCVSS